MSKFNIDLSVQNAEEACKSLWVRPEIETHLQSKYLTIQQYPPVQAGNVAFTGQIPHDLSQLTDDQLTYLLSMIGSWEQYVLGQLALYQTDLRAAEETMDVLWGTLYIQYRYDEIKKKRPEAERKAMIFTDQRYINAKKNLLYQEGLVRLTKPLAEAAARNWSTVSRRISQRGQDIERQKRNDGVQYAGGWGR
jgi:hypothetical protein